MTFITNNLFFYNHWCLGEPGDHCTTLYIPNQPLVIEIVCVLSLWQHLGGNAVLLPTTNPSTVDPTTSMRTDICCVRSTFFLFFLDLCIYIFLHRCALCFFAKNTFPEHISPDMLNNDRTIRNTHVFFCAAPRG